MSVEHGLDLLQDFKSKFDRIRRERSANYGVSPKILVTDFGNRHQKIAPTLLDKGSQQVAFFFEGTHCFEPEF